MPYDIKPFVSVEVEYLKELYDEIAGLKKQLDMLDDEMAALLEELASSRLKRRSRPPVFRERTQQ